MEKKYSFRGVIGAVLFSLLYYAIYFALQIAAVYLVAAVSPYASFIEQMTLELSIIGNCLCVLVFALIFKFTSTPLSEKAYINPFPSRFFVSMIILGVATTYGVALALGYIEGLGIIPEEWLKSQEEAYADVYTASPVMQFFCVGLMAPVLEEILFRGLILGTLKKEMHPWVAIIVSAVAFGAAHGTPISFIYATGLGLLMGWLFVKFNSILPTIIFHMAYNCTTSFSENIYPIVAILSIPIMILTIKSIKNYFRGNQR